MSDEKFANGTKETWRGWVWNRLSERLPKGSRVLVLCGDVAGDIPFAKKHKMEVIGVDINKDCVSTFRDAGGLATQMPIHEAIGCFRPDAVIFDMMGGLTNRSFYSIFMYSLIPNVVVWNVLRGRDNAEWMRGKSNLEEKHRGKLVWDFAMATADWRLDWSFVYHNKRDTFELRRMQKNRDVQNETAKILMGFDIGTWNHPTQPHRLQQVIVAQAWQEKFLKLGKPEFYEYRSKDSGCYYDSCIWTNSGWPLKVGLGMTEEKWNILENHIPVDSKRKAAAIKALLTMRKKVRH